MHFFCYSLYMDNIQQIADAMQKGLELIFQASIQEGSTRLGRCVSLELRAGKITTVT